MRMRLSFEPNVRPTCRPYTKLMVCERFLNVQTSKQRGKNVSWSRVPAWWRGPPPVVQLVQWLIWHCLSGIFLLLFVKVLTFVLLFSYEIAYYETHLHLLFTRTSFIINQLTSHDLLRCDVIGQEAYDVYLLLNDSPVCKVERLTRFSNHLIVIILYKLS